MLTGHLVANHFKQYNTIYITLRLYLTMKYMMWIISYLFKLCMDG